MPKYDPMLQPGVDVSVTGTPERASVMSTTLRLYWEGATISPIAIVCDDARHAQILADAINKAIVETKRPEVIEAAPTVCGRCDGDGRVNGREAAEDCPECYGRGTLPASPRGML